MAAGGGWLRGVIKEVVSGDTVVVIGAVKGGPPPEKRITLSSLQAPKLGRRDGTSKDEPFAWQSREFLRVKSIGQPCVFRIDYTLEGVSREFGSVFIGQSQPPENLALTVVQNGWAKVRGGQNQSPFFEELSRAQEMAEQNGLGLFSKDPEALAGAVRQLPVADNGQALDAMELLATMGKGKPLPAIVEQVLNGSTLRVLLLPTFHTATVMVCGLQSPSMGRRNAENPDSDPVPEPFAREAKHFTELRVLNREVRVVLEGVDKYNNLFGTVKFVVNEQPVDLGEQIVSNGLAKVVDWGLAMMTNGAVRLREGERAAKLSRLAMWRDYVPPASANTKLAGEYKGKVIEVVSGDTLIIKDPNGVENRVALASIRAPRFSRQPQKPSEPFAIEAKEFVRKNLIGKIVNVKMEYDRTIPAKTDGDEAHGAGQVMRFGNVTFEDVGLDGQSKTKNIAEMLVERGLAATQAHRSDDERSCHYEVYIEAENRAKKDKKGMQGNPDKAAVHRMNDVSQGAGLKHAKQYLPFLTRGRVPAIVDFVMSGHRYKLYSPKEGVQFAFSPSGIKTPNRAQPANPEIGKGPVTEEPYAIESYSFARENLMQREVEIQVETMDKGGTFLGTIFVPSLKPTPNFGLLMLQQGLARLHPMFDPARVAGGHELAEAQAAAKQARIKIWENYVEEKAEAAEAPESSNGNGHIPSSRSSETVTVTEVQHGRLFYVQRLSEPRVAWLEDQLSQLSLGGGPPVKGLPPKRGDLCIAQFSLDKRWYRAYVDNVSGNNYDMVFIDFGNKEQLTVDRVRSIEPALSAVPAQAIPCSLAYVKVPALDSEHGVEAAEYLAHLVANGRPMEMVTITTEKPEGGKNPLLSKPSLQVVLSDARAEESSSHAPQTVNELMLAAGLAKVKLPRGRVPPADEELVKVLEAAAKRAKQSHVGIWQYGDPGDSDEEEERPRGAWGRRS